MWLLSASVSEASKRAQHAYLILQALDRIGKLPDVAEAVRAFPVVCVEGGRGVSGVEMAVVVLCLQRCAVLSPLLPPQHEVQTRVLRVRQVRGDNLVARATKSELHQSDDLR